MPPDPLNGKARHLDDLTERPVSGHMARPAGALEFPRRLYTQDFAEKPVLDPRDRPYSPCAQFYGAFRPVDKSGVIRLPVVYRAPQLDTIWADVIHATGLTLHEMETMSRARPFVTARQAFMWTAWEVRKADGRRRYSLNQIADFIARKTGAEVPLDHTTILSGHRRHAKRLRSALMDRVRADDRAMVSIHGA